MVFAANGATVVDGRVLRRPVPARRARAEAAAYLEWFRAHGYQDVRAGRSINEGEGDYLVAGQRILAGTGFRTDRALARGGAGVLRPAGGRA